MRCQSQASAGHDDIGSDTANLPTPNFRAGLLGLASLLALTAIVPAAFAQVNVVTAHNDIGRTGQNLNETVLAPSNVNSSQFGQLFSQPVTGNVYAQPLYVPNVTIGGAVHNVVYVATGATSGTNSDFVYAFDADNNGGVNASPLWQVSLASIATPAGPYVSRFGVIGTPVIDLSSKTMYLVSSEQSKTDVYRLHALDITTGAEKFGGPMQIQASVPGTGTGSSGGTLVFAPKYELQRSGLLLLNGVVYFAFASIGDQGPWHGWLFSYNAATLNQLDVFCPSANGSGTGIWMGGAGLAAEVNNSKKPFGRMFLATGNGTYAASTPYTTAMSYGMSMLDLDLTGGIMTVEDTFTPYNEAALDSGDGDLGSGGPLLLPAQTQASGQSLNPLVQIGKSGMIYILDRNNLGGYNATSDQVVQEVQTPIVGSFNWGVGVWGTEAYWNNNIYTGGTGQAAGDPGVGNNPEVSGNSLTAYSFVNGVLSPTPSSQSAQKFLFPGPTPSISANGTQNGIVWVINEHGPADDAILLAYDATNLQNLLYSSNTNRTRDQAGPAVDFTLPTIANGKVYVGTGNLLNIYGLLSPAKTVAAPVINPAGGTFTGSQTVTITDATSGAQIYYTTDGSTPTANSTLYNSAHPIVVTATETITAIASATGYLQGAPVSAVFTSAGSAANPVFSLPGGTYTGPQTLTITDSSSNPTIYYTVDGTTPTTAAAKYTQPIAIPVGEVVQAIATSPGLQASSVVSASYDIDPAYTINFSQGFTNAYGPMQFNGSTDLDDFRLQLTNGGTNEAGSAFYATPVPIWAFTTDFTFQLSNPNGDGITFTIQGVGPSALGVSSQGLGYKGITKSVAIKFSIRGDLGQGNDSTGLYLNGAAPTLPSIDLTNTVINLHSGDYMNAHITYDDKNLNLTITDAVTLASWSYSWAVDIPQQLGGSLGYVGFTGSTGGSTASQKLTSWTYLGGNPLGPNYPVGFDPVNGTSALTMNGNAALSGTNLEMTTGALNQASSAYFAFPVDIAAFASDFDFIIAPGSTSTLADGIAFVIQKSSHTALGTGGIGLGYSGIPHSVAIKFDIYNDSGEGNDSTGVYLDGAIPTVPSINLTSSGLQLSSGDTIHAHITYDGTTLTWTLTDTTAASHPSATESATLNIPHTVGGNTAYIGFTGGSGSQTSIEKILDWTFTNP